MKDLHHVLLIKNSYSGTFAVQLKRSRTSCGSGQKEVTHLAFLISFQLVENQAQDWPQISVDNNHVLHFWKNAVQEIPEND